MMFWSELWLGGDAGTTVILNMEPDAEVDVLDVAVERTEVDLTVDELDLEIEVVEP